MKTSDILGWVIFAMGMAATATYIVISLSHNRKLKVFKKKSDKVIEQYIRESIAVSVDATRTVPTYDHVMWHINHLMEWQTLIFDHNPELRRMINNAVMEIITIYLKSNGVQHQVSERI